MRVPVLILNQLMGSACRLCTLFERGVVAFTLVAYFLVAIASAQINRRIVLDASDAIPYFIEEGPPDSGYQRGDQQLGVWALENWSRVSDRRLRFQRVSTKEGHSSVCAGFMRFTVSMVRCA